MVRPLREIDAVTSGDCERSFGSSCTGNNSLALLLSASDNSGASEALFSDVSSFSSSGRSRTSRLLPFSPFTLECSLSTSGGSIKTSEKAIMSQIYEIFGKNSNLKIIKEKRFNRLNSHHYLIIKRLLLIIVQQSFQSSKRRSQRRPSHQRPSIFEALNPRRSVILYYSVIVINNKHIKK